MELSLPQHTALPSSLSFCPPLRRVHSSSSVSSKHINHQYTRSTLPNQRCYSNITDNQPRTSWCEPMAQRQAASQRPRPELKYQYTFHASQHLDQATPLSGDDRIDNPRNGTLYADPTSVYAFRATWPRRTIMACIYCRQRKVRRTP